MVSLFLGRVLNPNLSDVAISIQVLTKVLFGVVAGPGRMAGQFSLSAIGVENGKDIESAAVDESGNIRIFAVFKKEAFNEV